jgi:hypothetical protein
VIVMPVRQSTEQDTFLAIVCADTELLRAEFEAIINAGWNQPTQAIRPVRPPTRPDRPRTSRQPSRPRRPDRPNGQAWIRQRAPPPGLARHRTQPRTDTAERQVMS